MNNRKIINILLIVVIIIFQYSISIYATDSMIQGADDFLDSGEEDILNKDKIKEISDRIFYVFLAVGTSIVVIMGAIIGIKFIFGSVEAKAEMKESLIPYLTGGIIIFGAMSIWILCIKIFQAIF